MFLTLASKSLLSRRGSVLLTLLAVSVSIFVLLAVEHIREQTRESFGNSVSGIDLIVGARTGNLNLLLYSVFRIGQPTNNIRWQTYQSLASHRLVKWTIPISLGDSHKGYRVMGTNQSYFEHFRYGKQRPLDFHQGRRFEAVLDVVLGYEVAKTLGYQLDDKIVLSHGIAATSFSNHQEHPFKVVGILAPTGTPVDQTLHVPLEGIEAIHKNWNRGVQAGPGLPAELLESYHPTEAQPSGQLDLTPASITAFMVGLTSKMATFRIQRDINQYAREPLTAILPGVALTELWQMTGILEKTLRLISVLVLISALLGMSAMLLASIREREQEIRLLRTMGASPWYLFALIELEALMILLAATLLSTGSLALLLTLAQDHLVAAFGVHIENNLLSPANLKLIGLIGLAGLISAFIPALMAYSKSLK
jgi:putative ABC transport system permease protein